MKPEINFKAPLVNNLFYIRLKLKLLTSNLVKVQIKKWEFVDRAIPRKTRINLVGNLLQNQNLTIRTSPLLMEANRTILLTPTTQKLITRALKKFTKTFLLHTAVEIV